MQDCKTLRQRNRQCIICIMCWIAARSCQGHQRDTECGNTVKGICKVWMLVKLKTDCLDSHSLFHLSLCPLSPSDRWRTEQNKPNETSTWQNICWLANWQVGNSRSSYILPPWFTWEIRMNNLRRVKSVLLQSQLKKCSAANNRLLFASRLAIVLYRLATLLPRVEAATRNLLGERGGSVSFLWPRGTGHAADCRTAPQTFKAQNNKLSSKKHGNKHESFIVFFHHILKAKGTIP